jgi:hypothetical protein
VLSAFKGYFAGAAATPKLEVRYILDTTARSACPSLSPGCGF